MIFLWQRSLSLLPQPINLINDVIKLIKTRIIAHGKLDAIHREGKIYCLHIFQLHFFLIIDLSHVGCCTTACARRVLDQICFKPREMNSCLRARTNSECFSVFYLNESRKVSGTALASYDLSTANRKLLLLHYEPLGQLKGSTRYSISL